MQILLLKKRDIFCPTFELPFIKTLGCSKVILSTDKEQKLSAKFIFDGSVKLFVGIFRTPLQQVVHGNLASAKFHLSLEFEWLFTVLLGQNAQNGDDDVS